MLIRRLVSKQSVVLISVALVLLISSNSVDSDPSTGSSGNKEYTHEHDHIAATLVDDDNTCRPHAQKNFKSIAIVGLGSAIIFAFVCTLPSFFIRTDADKTKFGE